MSAPTNENQQEQVEERLVQENNNNAENRFKGDLRSRLTYEAIREEFNFYQENNKLKEDIKKLKDEMNLKPQEENELLKKEMEVLKNYHEEWKVKENKLAESGFPTETEFFRFIDSQQDNNEIQSIKDLKLLVAKKFHIGINTPTQSDIDDESKDDDESEHDGESKVEE